MSKTAVMIEPMHDQTAQEEAFQYRCEYLQDLQTVLAFARTHDLSQAIVKERLLPALKKSCPKHIVVSGISCRHQLQAHTSQPVRHWIELMAEQLK